MAETYVAPSRQGKKSLTVWADPEFIDMLKHEVIREKTTVQDYVLAAVEKEMKKNATKRKNLRDEG